MTAALVLLFLDVHGHVRDITGRPHTRALVAACRQYASMPGCFRVGGGAHYWLYCCTKEQA